MSSSSMHILVRDLRLYMGIGIYPAEKLKRQEVLVNIEAEITAPANPLSDEMDDWVSYETVVRAIQAIAARGHIGLLETFAGMIADDIMRDKRVTDLTVRLEKTAAIPETRSVGVELRRTAQ